MSNNNAENRSYGQGAQGESTPQQRTKVSFWTKFRYSFDNSIAKPGAFVFYLVFSLLIFSVLLVVIRYALYAVPFLLDRKSVV